MSKKKTKKSTAKAGALTQTQLFNLAAHVRTVLIDNAKAADAYLFIDPHVRRFELGLKDKKDQAQLLQNIVMLQNAYEHLFFVDETPGNNDK